MSLSWICLVTIGACAIGNVHTRLLFVILLRIFLIKNYNIIHFKQLYGIIQKPVNLETNWN